MKAWVSHTVPLNIQNIAVLFQPTQQNVCVCVCVIVAQDLAQYVNEVKRDNETLREIDQYQRSIENLVNKSFSTTLTTLCGSAKYQQDTFPFFNDNFSCQQGLSSFASGL